MCQLSHTRRHYQRSKRRCGSGHPVHQVQHPKATSTLHRAGCTVDLTGRAKRKQYEAPAEHNQRTEIEGSLIFSLSARQLMELSMLVESWNTSLVHRSAIQTGASPRSLIQTRPQKGRGHAPKALHVLCEFSRMSPCFIIEQWF